MTEDRRNPRRPFDPILIQGFLQGRGLDSVQMFASGKSNSNYKLVLTNGEVYVLRLHAGGTSARENYILKLVKDIVPVPTVLDQGDDWTIHSYIEGEHLADVPEYTRAAAEQLARIGSIKFEAEGWIEADRSISPFAFENDTGFVPTILERSEVRTWIGQDGVKAIYSILDAEAQRTQDATGEYCLCHGDFNPTNILIRDGAVSGILDWEFAHSGGRDMDIGNLLRNTSPAFHDQIQSGLKAGGIDLPDDWKQRAEFADLGSHLEFLTTRRSDTFKKQCVNWIHDFIKRYKYT